MYVRVRVKTNPLYSVNKGVDLLPTSTDPNSVGVNANSALTNAHYVDTGNVDHKGNVIFYVPQPQIIPDNSWYIWDSVIESWQAATFDIIDDPNDLVNGRVQLLKSTYKDENDIVYNTYQYYKTNARGNGTTERIVFSFNVNANG